MGRVGSHQKAGSSTRPCSFGSLGRINRSEEGRRTGVPRMEGTGKPFPQCRPWALPASFPFALSTLLLAVALSVSPPLCLCPYLCLPCSAWLCLCFSLSLLFLVSLYLVSLIYPLSFLSASLPVSFCVCPSFALTLHLSLSVMQDLAPLSYFSLVSVSPPLPPLLPSLSPLCPVIQFTWVEVTDLGEESVTAGLALGRGRQGNGQEATAKVQARVCKV